MSAKCKWKYLFVLPLLCLPFYLSSCNAGAQAAKAAPLPTPSAEVSVSVTPATASIRASSSLTFASAIKGTSNSAATWSVNNTAGGSTALGTIDASGNYTAPATVPSPNQVTVTATSVADTSKSSSSTVTILNATPAIGGISPAIIDVGTFSLTVTGKNFVSGAHVLFNGNQLATTVVSSTQLTATGTASSAGTEEITVENPDPGSSVSGPVNLQVNGSQTPVASSTGCSQMSLGQGASLNGFVPFPSNSGWNTDISSAPVDANSDAIIAFIGAGRGLHPDFGSGLYQGSYIGIAYTVVDSTQAQIPINYTEYGSESDPGPMAIPLTAPIEGYPNIPSNGDRHVLVLDKSNCFLYELFGGYNETANWNAKGGAVWDLLANEQRPYEWTSADAAGLPIFPGLVRYDEVASGAINHAIRCTVAYTRAAFIPPASHWAATSNSPTAPPMGMRLRLKASFDVSKFSKTNQVIFNAMKKYGLIVADNGTSMYIGGAPDERWNNSDLHELDGAITSDFEVIKMDPVYTASNMPTGEAPKIASFSASETSISSGGSVTLSWNVSGASYVIVSPSIGVTRGSSVSVTPTSTTTYTLYATNAYGRTTASVTITVK